MERKAGFLKKPTGFLSPLEVLGDKKKDFFGGPKGTLGQGASWV